MTQLPKELEARKILIKDIIQAANPKAINIIYDGGYVLPASAVEAKLDELRKIANSEVSALDLKERILEALR